MPEPLAITVKEAAELLSCSDDQIRSLVDSGVLEAINIGTGKQYRCLRVLRHSIEQIPRVEPRNRKPTKSKSTAPMPTRRWV